MKSIYRAYAVGLVIAFFQWAAVEEGRAFETSDQPVVQTGFAITSSKITKLQGRANPNGYDTFAYFEFGTSANLGSQTEVMAMGSGDDWVPVKFVLPGVEQGQSYYYRLVATNLQGIAFGDVQRFTGGALMVTEDAVLRESLEGGGVLRFDCDGTIKLTNTLTITQDTVLDGAGHSVSLNGSNAVRLFYVATNVTLTLNNLVLANGRFIAPSTDQETGFMGAGGAIFNEGGTVLLTNMVFSNNVAIGGNGYEVGGIGCGGALYNGMGTMAIDHCSFLVNASTGGGCYLGYGAGACYGGSIFNEGTNLIVQNSFFRQNSASGRGPGSAGLQGPGAGYGGAICSRSGQFILTASSFTENGASGGYGMNYNGRNAMGGALHIGGGSANVTNCLFARNAASAGRDGYHTQAGTGAGGAIYNDGTLKLVNCTFSTNNANLNRGGGLWNNAGTAELLNTTFIGNSAPYGANLSVSAGPVTLRNTIIAYGATANCEGVVVDGGNNLQWPGATCGATILTADPLLGPLADNGGATLTHDLLPGSRAIDTGNDAVAPAFDQRGVARPQGTHVDIGAVEFVSTTSIQWLANGKLQLKFSSNPNQTCTLQTSSDLTHWTDLESSSADAQGNVSFEALNDQPIQFFRIKP